ncbi:hypothetical protein RJ639_016214 [Escallonia herrerae]|uniref:Uncharacterized protein n=1 Tax=Escallonia herrerae TaxID=1293975 RepID=A0AA88VDZ8_9ASTE|nr:hypothetical protein RJ639_016214 [Escallonia herrerae]
MLIICTESKEVIVYADSAAGLSTMDGSTLGAYMDPSLEMSDDFILIVPCFGLHPWFVAERTDSWLNSLKDFLKATSSSAFGEIGVDKGSHGRKTHFTDQIMKTTGPFLAGVILHSYLGSADMVPEFTKLGAYFSFSGFLVSLNENKAKKMLKSIA